VVIPRVFHQIWVGPEPFPKRLGPCRHSWLAFNPGWELRFWTEENLPRDLRRREALDRLRVPAERADILRLELLWRFGGVYVDCDFECLRSIEELIEEHDFFCAYREPGAVSNGLVGSTPGHQILERALAQLEPVEVYGYDGSAAGPEFFGGLLQDYPDAKIFEPQVFHPTSREQRAAAYAVHHDRPSWKDPGELRDELARLERLVTDRQAEAFEWKQRYLRVQAELEPRPTASRPSPSTLSRASNEQLIPPVFHQIWLGPDPVPEDYVAYRQTWIDRHPGWQLRVWTDDDLPEDARRPEVYERLRTPVERANILRLELLWRFGGVYVDCDFECLRSIEPLLGGLEFFAGYRKRGHANNAIIGSVQAHAVLDRALDDIRPQNVYGPVAKEGTGVLFFNRVLAEFPDVTLFEPNVFYPRSAGAMREAYAVHHRARTWRDPDALRRSIRKAEERLQSATELAQERELQATQVEAELARLKRTPTGQSQSA
jgi:inositol phosphorylceramide mannosyltransferase catalytic subunit